MNFQKKNFFEENSLIEFVLCFQTIAKLRYRANLNVLDLQCEGWDF